MNHYEKLCEIKKLTDKLGLFYGTEDFSIYLYSLIKMTKPSTVLELGTGSGTSMLWIALALEENKRGVLHTVDNGADWDNLKQLKDSCDLLSCDNYFTFVNSLISKFDFDNVVNFYNEEIHFKNLRNIDILFSDFKHDQYYILNVLSKVIPVMSENSYIFIDSASTYYPSFLLLENVIEQLNQNVIPKTLMEMITPFDNGVFRKKISESNFQLSHIIENKDRNQNSTACIKITPKDIFPQPRINIRL